MTRKIKFRAWHKNLLEMQNDVHLLDRLSEIISRPETYEVMQFTGLKDKNGVDSYDGNIIQDEEATYKIYWAEDAAAWDLERLQDGSNMIGFGCYTRDVISDIIQSSKTIGNIYQNPELLTT